MGLLVFNETSGAKSQLFSTQHVQCEINTITLASSAASHTNYVTLHKTSNEKKVAQNMLNSISDDKNG